MADRAKALGLAVQISKPGILSWPQAKANETYQVTNQGTIHFDDKEHLTDACTSLLTPKPWNLMDLSTALGCEAVNASAGSLAQMPRNLF